jgi:hypothetical protein
MDARVPYSSRTSLIAGKLLESAAICRDLEAFGAALGRYVRPRRCRVAGPPPGHPAFGLR